MLKGLAKASVFVIIFSINASYGSETSHVHDHDEDNEFEEHAAHEHGHATAQITFVDGILIFNLSLPSINIFGFEHGAINKEQEKIITQSTSVLKDGRNIIVIEPNNSCELASMNIESDIINSLNSDTHEHQEEHDEHHGEHMNEEHSDVSVRHEYICSKDSPNSINYTIFNSFPTIEEIEIQYISNNSQTLSSATPHQPIQFID